MKANAKIYRYFQAIYHKTVGEGLRVQLGTKALVISILVPILSTGSVVLTHYVIHADKARKAPASFVLQILPYCYLDALTYMLGAYWYMSCEALTHAARILAEHFQKVALAFNHRCSSEN
jgi:gustatory receptor